MRTSRILLIALFAITVAPVVAAAAPPAFVPPGAVITGTPAVGEELECDADVVSDGALAANFRWKYGSFTSPANSSTFTVPASAAGRELSCTITISDEQGSATSTATVTIADAAPGFSGQVTISQTSNSAPQCRVTAGPSGTVYGGHTTETVSWTLNGVTYAQLPSPLPDGLSGTCTITIANAFGSASATSALKTLTNVRPRFGVPPAISGDPKAGSTLTCSGGGFRELHGWTEGAEWLVGDSVVASGPTYVLPATAVGATACRITARFGALAVSTAEDRVIVLRAPKVTLPVKQPVRTFAKALALGLQTRVEFVGSCSVASTLTVPGSVARSVGLLPKKSKAATATVGTQGAQSAQSSFVASAKFSANAKKRLAKLKAFAVTHSVTVTCQGMSTTTNRVVRLTAPKKR